MKKSLSPVSNPTNIPRDGMSRWKQMEPFIPFSKETFRKMVRAGRAPQPIELSKRCTCYSNKEIHKFFEDIQNYRAETKKDAK